MSEDSLLPFHFPAIARKKVTAAFDGGRIASSGGLKLLAAAGLVTHSVADILRAPILAIARGYEDGNDLDHLRTSARERHGPVLATNRVGVGERARPARGRGNELRHDRHLLRQPCPPAPREVTLDIDDSVDFVHGAQQFSLFNTHYGERCFLPMHVYETATGRPVAVLLRSGKTPRAGKWAAR